MAFVRRVLFYLGLATGVVTVAAVGMVALTYLLTGKFASVTLEKGKPAVALVSPAEVVEQVRQQVAKARTAAAGSGGEGGGHDES